MPSFLGPFCRLHKKSLLYLIPIVLGALYWILGQDMPKLFPIEPSKEKQECLLRLLSISILGLLFVSYAFVLSLISYDKLKAEKYPPDLTEEDRKRYREMLKCPKCGTSII